MSINRLSKSLSPYLLQHANNPVHWQMWDEEAFSLAKHEDKPIFLSVGYSSCHWCHVMEHESFENEEIAELLNEHFISIKVDREERPDVDDAYMTAVQLSTGRGGWPMSVFMTPDGKPFFTGTYFPPDDRGGYPGFKTIVFHIAKAWKEKREDLIKTAEEFASVLERHRTISGHSFDGKFSFDLVMHGAREVMAEVHTKQDQRPKFPPHSALRFLLHLAKVHRNKECLDTAVHVLDTMMLGGIHDHVGGGFHRYSTDEIWLVPHFEKMLYDNAMLLESYGTAFDLTKNEEYKRVCERIAGWLLREMQSGEGLFYSALDADSEGEEGLFYTWTWQEIHEILGERAGDFIDAFGVKQEGNYREEISGELTGRNILHLKSQVGNRFDEELALLLTERNKRIHPGLDNKCLISWNGLAISGLCKSGYLDEAKRAADYILKLSPFPHQVVNGKKSGVPFLESIYFVGSLLDLHDFTNEQRYFDAAKRLFSEMKEEYHDDISGGWYFSGKSREIIFGNPKPALDGATLSPNGIAIQCAIRLGDLECAEKDLRALHMWMIELPTATETLHQALDMYLQASPEKEIGVLKSSSSVSISLEKSEVEVMNGQAHANLIVDIPQGSYIAGTSPEVGMSEFQITFSGAGTWRADLLNKQKFTESFNVPIIGVPPNGQEGNVIIQISYQECNETMCLQPESRELELVWYRR